MSQTRIRRFASLSALLVVLLIVGLLANDFQLIDGDGIGQDAAQNVKTALNLVQHGIYSKQPISFDVTPGFRREPLPNFLLAFYLRVADLIYPGLLDQVNQPFSDGFLSFVKRINLVWAGGLFGGLWLTAVLIFSPLFAAHWLAGIQILVVNHFFVLKTVNDMNTELIAGMIIVWLGVVLLMTSRSRSLRWFLASGVAFGLMALTKATGAYVALILLPLVALVTAGVSKRFWLSFLAISFGFVITVMPWLVRNQIHFSKFVIAQGGGDVLLIRSVFNEMNWQQFGDAFYAYAPRELRHDLLGPLMGLSDDEFSCDGRLSVFTRDLECDRQALSEQRYGDVKSFYQRGKRAIPRELSLDRDGKKDLAIDKFREQPSKVLIAALPIGWRGFWGFRARVWSHIVLNAASYSALFMAPFLAFVERKISWLMVSVVPVSFFLFYSFFSHFLPRYSMPFIPSSLVCLAMLAVDITARIARRMKLEELPFVRLL